MHGRCRQLSTSKVSGNSDLFKTFIPTPDNNGLNKKIIRIRYHICKFSFGGYSYL